MPVRTRRVGAYGVCRRADGRVLMVRASAAAEFPGLWGLPGGGVDHGEHPVDALVRGFRAETGLELREWALRSVTADVRLLPRSGVVQHTDRIVYDVTPAPGELRGEGGDTGDAAEWVWPRECPLLPYAAHILGESAVRLPSIQDLSDFPLARPDRVQRFGAYALATDPDGRVLLTRIAPGYPGAGRWHLPGGGTDHGEVPERALARELFEETAQRGRVDGLLGISHRYDPAAVGPEGVPMSWHVIRALFRVHVDRPTRPTVQESGGSTAAAAWCTPSELAAKPLTDVVQAALDQVADGEGRLKSTPRSGHCRGG
ncbi:NUDIX hydrolase [Mangrovihabitans endophyticus]|uniref:Nudix hydrolase domain-containing protein n=1 Tax=Mangrovihabitans endophyticus TaxID=1751298 RepID=A0A8J3C0B3_9ACTN|nr:NUDIX hydrolase [Mangrovihabitans endophyticus]GGK92298.1 hypothetical protein GCM10012284_27670 [Mangrovihabitans endophyticus]